MGFIIGWAIVIFGILFIIGTITDDSEEVEKKEKENIFTTRVIEDKIIEENYDFDVFNIQIKGSINTSYDNCKVKFMLRAFDITDEELPIFSTLEEFQAENSRVLLYETEIDELPYKNTIFDNWITVISLPKLFLEYPRSGRRKIEFRIFVIDAKSRNHYASDRKIITYYNEEHGYLDKDENIEYFEEMLIKTAMLVSASDGTMDSNEANIIKGWIKKRLSGYNDHAVDAAKKRLNSYVKDVYTEINEGLIDIYAVLDGIENIVSESEKFELFQICLDVAQADGEADKAELKMVHDIADFIKLDRKQFRLMIEKTLPVTIHTSQANDETLLGIDNSMTNKEVRKHLREQYQKWNARVASSDSNTREQAEKMINLIAEARKKYS